MRIKTAVGGLLIALALPTMAAPNDLFENNGTVNTPVIDAVTFLNRGLFNVGAADVPYDTQNTRFYTNFPGAIIQGVGGMRFSRVGEDGFRHPADSFYNAGTIALDATGNSWVLIDATNVVNRGGISVGESGLMSIRGDNVQLSRSGLRAGQDPTAPINEGREFPPEYTNDSGVQDVYAGVGVNNVLDPAGPGPFNLNLLTGTPAFSGGHQVLQNGFTNQVNVAAPNAFAITNALGPTNWLVQVVFMNTNSADPFFKTDVRFGPPRNPSVDGAQMAMVQFTFEDVDTITGEPYTNFVYVLDNLGAMTNAIFFTNAFSPTDLRPSSTLITRVTPPEWDAGTGTNVIFAPTLFVSPDYVTDQVTNVYAAYSANIGPATRAPIFGGGGQVTGGAASFLNHPTNQPGRIEIEADSLDLNLTRIKSEGLLSIKTDNLSPKGPYKVDSTVVSYDVGSTAGPLVVSNLVETTVRRFTGNVRCWSGAWTNQTFSVGPDPADPTLQVTNTIDIRFHALIVGHNFQTTVPVETLNFSGRGVEIVIMDDLTVTEGLVLDTPILDVRAPIDAGSIPWNLDSLPSLRRLTNSGAMFTTDEFRLGTQTVPLDLVVNRGTMAGTFISVHSTEFENSGDLGSISGDIEIDVDALKLEGGSLISSANLRITTPDAKMTGATLASGTSSFGALILDVRDRLTDGGIDASNTWSVTDGIQLVRKPAESDLTGTEVYSFLNRFREGVHVWSAEDRGATAAGFVNNAALGKLTLDGTLFTLFTFIGPDSTTPYALYTDFLELTNAAVDVELSLNVATNLTIYFADSNVPADQLDGALGGRLRWVNDVAGARSGVPVTLSTGQSIRVNRSLLTSLTVDSDLDGIPNASDPAPFEAAALRVKVGILGSDPSQVEISWGATSGALYRVEYSARPQGAEWNVLATREHTDAAPGVVKVSDSLNPSGEQRFYRVVQVR